MGIFRQGRRMLACGVALGAATLASGAYAQGNSETELAPVVVEGQRVTGQPVQDGTQTKIDRTVLQKRAVADFNDISRSVDAGVNFDDTDGSINLRGLQDDRVLTTIDGVRVPWLVDPRESAKGGLAAFDLDSLSAVDILKGSDSSRLGSGALGGAVQLRTLDPEDVIEEGRKFGAILKGSYNSADRSWSSNAAIAARANDTWLLVQGGYKKGHETENMGDVGGYGSTRTEANPGDYDQQNILAKVHQYIEGGHRLGLTVERTNKDFDFENMSGTTASYEAGAFFAGNETDRKRVSAEYKFESPDKSDIVDTANLQLYWMDQKLNSTTDAIRLRDPRALAIPGDPFMYGFPFGVYQRDNWIKQTSYGFNGDGTKDIEIGGLSNSLRFGAELYRQKTTQYSWGLDNCPDVDWTLIPAFMGPQSCRFLHSNAADMPEVDSTFFGAYVEDDIKLFNDRLTLTPGVRFDWYDHSPKSTPEFQASLNYDPSYLVGQSDSRFSPKLKLAWQATSELELFAQWSQGYRAPSAKELYQNFANLGQYARLGNPDLKPETSNGFEIGASYEAANWGVSANVFNNYYRNFIEMISLGATPDFDDFWTYRNISRVQIYGAEARAHANFADYWSAWGSLAYVQGKDTDTGEYLNSIAPFRAILGLGYERETWGANVSTTLAAARDKVSGTGFSAPGYGIVDVAAFWAPEQVKGMRIQAGVYNLFDKKYWNALDVPDGAAAASIDRYTEPGRTFRISLTQKF